MPSAKSGTNRPGDRRCPLDDGGEDACNRPPSTGGGLRPIRSTYGGWAIAPTAPTTTTPTHAYPRNATIYLDPL
ncbi:MAG: hypothetical protein Fur0042_05950 [Cyanophyceae cyanobacterium]